jgi:hypothetical protein
MLLQLMHIINLFTLLFSTTGVLVHQHYCQDELKTLSFYTQSTKDCCKKHKASLAKSCDSSSPQINKKSCCENKTVLSIDDSVQESSIIKDGLVSIWNTYFTPAGLRLIEPVMEHLFLLDKNKQLRYYSYKAPPNKTPLHLLLCSFRC